ncbi:GGDEF domain-containing phosphodiesterase [Fibrobacter sp. UWH1]|uniref:GGDEF domain-containing phosphodiesterase n=1 Tax=Fibrobacter sp. UWH1 TaxID=1964354 RepID=UPI000B5251C0|nr:GGDEF domain-containing phosphodiesterase [Fibrobacter sp. UWH1]OWV08961.1 hypothetical protein B7992_12830 [Fibrobacter sp. UWH1]
MEFKLCSDMYREFREGLLSPITDPQDLLKQVSRQVTPLAKILNVGYMECGLVAPASPLAQNGVDGKMIIYHDKVGLPVLPSCTDIAEVMTTAESGTFTFNVHPVEGHTFTDNERDALSLISYDCFILGGRSRLMGMANRARITDYMTGAINQSGLMNFIGSLVAQKKLFGHTGIFTNLKNFKYINKSMSPQVGDIAMKAYVNAAKADLTSDEIIARLGGDNFFFLVRNDHANEIINKFSSLDVSLSQGPKPLNFKIQARMGVYTVREQDTVSELMNCSSIALNAAKNIKTTDIIRFNNDMLIEALHQREISSEFQNALKNGDFMVYYQPKVNLETKQLCGSEALVRWLRHKTVVPPTDFLPILEREGTVCLLDFYVFERVCSDIRQWVDAGIEPVRTSVNFSKLHLKNPNFAEDFFSIMNKYQVESRFLEVELTEVSDYEDFVAMQRFISTMRNHGISVSIDDFGTGYSTLNVIKNFDFNVVKLDKSLLDNIGREGSQDEIVLKNVVNMAKEMHKEVIAEGVENEKQAQFLSDVNCHRVQGFLFDRPLCREDFEKRLTGQKLY